MSTRTHWETVYGNKTESELSWHQEEPSLSFELMQMAGMTAASSVIDIGGGTSRIVDGLIGKGLVDISVLDLSENAIAASQHRLGAESGKVTWINSDVTRWRPGRVFDIWHDRAVFHFLIDPIDREAYKQRLADSLAPQGHAIIASFALDGPEKCSGLPVMRYSPETLSEALGDGFMLLAHRSHLHQTPWGNPQSFQYSLFRKQV